MPLLSLWLSAVAFYDSADRQTPREAHQSVQENLEVVSAPYLDLALVQLRERSHRPLGPHDKCRLTSLRTHRLVSLPDVSTLRVASSAPRKKRHSTQPSNV